MMTSCGLDLRSWTTVASLYSMVLSMMGLNWSVQLLLNLTISPTGSVLNQPNFSAQLPDRKVIGDIMWFSFILQIGRFITSFALLYGNKSNRLLSVCSWLFTTSLLLLWSIGSSIYITSQLPGSLRELNDSKDENSNSFYSYIILLGFFSGGLLPWILDACFLYFVILRVKEIFKENTEISVRDVSYRVMFGKEKNQAWFVPTENWTTSDDQEDPLSDEFAMVLRTNPPLLDDSREVLEAMA